MLRRFHINAGSCNNAFFMFLCSLNLRKIQKYNICSCLIHVEPSAPSPALYVLYVSSEEFSMHLQPPAVLAPQGAIEGS